MLGSSLQRSDNRLPLDTKPSSEHSGSGLSVRFDNSQTEFKSLTTPKTLVGNLQATAEQLDINSNRKTAGY